MWAEGIGLPSERLFASAETANNAIDEAVSKPFLHISLRSTNTSAFFHTKSK
jgi:hypothetical protein